MRTFALLLSGALLAAGAAGAAEPADTAAQAKKICKKPQPPPGSRLGAKAVCATKEEWRAYVDPAKRDTRNNFELIQRRGLRGS